jgi:aryl-alcohol dehydrogenase-like predicted oxidoreductase
MSFRSASPIAFGSFKIGRNEGIKYAEGYALPSEDEAISLVREAIALGIRHIDTAPAYGLAERRVGLALAGLAEPVSVSTKVGERFESGRSTYDFSAGATRSSVARSRDLLGRGRLDLVLVHSSGDDERILREEGVTAALRGLREEGAVAAIGFSAKSLAGALAALEAGYDSLMLEYHPSAPSLRPAFARAAGLGRSVLVKKALASGRLAPAEAIPFALAAPAVTCVVVGSLRASHLSECIALAQGKAGPVA